VLIGIVDTVMVGRLGEAAVSGVSLVDSINVLITILLSSLTTGGAVVTSQYLGRRDTANASESAKHLIYASALFALALSLVMFFTRNALLHLIYGNLAPDVMQEAETYFFWTAFTYPFLALNTAGSALFRCMGNSRVGMWISLLVNVLNFAGDAFLIFGCQLGVAGAAIATLLSRFISGVVIIGLLYAQKKGMLSLRGIFRPQFSFGIIRSILKIAVPSGVEGAMFQFGKIALARLVTLFGTTAIAGNALGNIFMTIGNLPGVAVGNAMLVVVGQCLGAGDTGLAKAYTKKLVGWSYAIMIVFNSIIIASMPLIFRLFPMSQEALDYGRLFGTIFCTAAMVVWIPAYGLPNALRAAGDAAFTMWVAAFAMWLIRVGVAYLLAYAFGVGAVCVWISMVCEWAVRGACFTIRWASGASIRKKVI
jgi:putative MATE family efflux protein